MCSDSLHTGNERQQFFLWQSVCQKGITHIFLLPCGGIDQSCIAAQRYGEGSDRLYRRFIIVVIVAANVAGSACDTEGEGHSAVIGELHCIAPQQRNIRQSAAFRQHGRCAEHETADTAQVGKRCEFPRRIEFVWQSAATAAADSRRFCSVCGSVAEDASVAGMDSVKPVPFTVPPAEDDERGGDCRSGGESKPVVCVDFFCVSGASVVSAVSFDNGLLPDSTAVCAMSAGKEPLSGVVSESVDGDCRRPENSAVRGGGFCRFRQVRRHPAALL